MKKSCVTLLFIAIGMFSTLAEVSVRDYTFIGGNSQSKNCYMQQKYRFWGANRYPKDKNFKGRLIVLASSKATFTFWMPGKMKDGKWSTSLGMCAPSKANWFCGGFFRIRSGKFDSNKASAEIGNISHGEAGSFSICWQAQGIKAETKIILPDDEDKLLISTKLVKYPSNIKSYIVVLRCYPGSLGGGWKAGLKLRQRRAMTLDRKISINQDVQKVVLSKKEAWCLFYDDYFDVAKNRGEGPCAFLFNPMKTAKTIVTVANYSCSASLIYYAKKQSDIMVYDFNKLTNKQAIDYMKSLKILVE
jgi:hypothetical protein